MKKVNFIFLTAIFKKNTDFPLIHVI